MPIGADNPTATPPPADDDPPLGPPAAPGDLGTLGPYRVVRLLGRGGMGAVYLGIDPKLCRKVALKVMLPRFLARPAARDRFVREARAVAAVRGEHVVTVYQVDDAGGLPFIALEYLRGTSLEDYLRAHPVPELPAVLRVGKEIARGLEDAHALGVIHRDVKPDNVWLEAPHGKVKLIDFGLARVPAGGTSRSADGLVVGTPSYMSPEQARGALVDHRSDLFSLGVILFRLVTGRLPFAGATAVDQLTSLLSGPAPAVRATNPHAPAPLADLIDRLLSIDPAGRPKSAAAVAEELGRIAGGLTAGPPLPSTVPIPAPLDSTWAALSIHPGTPTPAPAGGRTAAGVLVAVAAAVGLLGAGLLAGMLTRRPADDARVERTDPPARKPADPPRPVRGVSAEWAKKLADAPADEQARLVARELGVRNRRFEGPTAVTPTIEQGRLVGLEIVSVAVTDLAPAAALPHLRTLAVRPPAGQTGVLTDLSPLADLPLTELRLTGNPVADLSPLARQTDLRVLHIDRTDATDLSPLAGLPLEELHVGPKPIDLGLVAGPRLRRVRMIGHVPGPDSPLRRLAALETVNGIPAAVHWERQERRAGGPSAVPYRVFRPDGGVRKLAVSADGQVLAAGGDVLRLWRWTAGGRVPAGWRERAVADGLAGFLGPDRRLAVVENDNKLHLRDADGTRFGASLGYGGHLLPAVAAPAGGWLAAAVQPIGGEGHLVAVLDPATGSRTATAAVHATKVRALAASADGRFLVSASADPVLRRWAVEGGGLTDLSGPAVGGWTAVGFAPCGTALVALAADGTVALWADAGDHLLARWTVPGATTVAASADGRQAVVGLADGWVAVYEPGRERPVREFAGAAAPVTALAFTPDGRTLFTANEKSEIRAWDWPALFAPPPVPGPMPVGFTPLFTGTDLTGWRPGFSSPEAAWRPVPGGAATTGAWGWLVTEREYAEFELRLEYRWLAPGGDSGVAFWADLNSTPADTGVEVMLNDDANFAELHPTSEPEHERTGGLWRFADATADSNCKLGEWNALTVRVRDGRVTVVQNGVTLTDAAVAELKTRVDGHAGLMRGRGRIGLQANKGGIEFRNVAVKE